jgi:hypothetical protein
VVHPVVYGDGAGGVGVELGSAEEVDGAAAGGEQALGSASAEAMVECFTLAGEVEVERAVYRQVGVPPGTPPAR